MNQLSTQVKFNQLSTYFQVRHSFVSTPAISDFKKFQISLTTLKKFKKSFETEKFEISVI